MGCTVELWPARFTNQSALTILKVYIIKVINFISHSAWSTLTDCVELTKRTNSSLIKAYKSLAYQDSVCILVVIDTQSVNATCWIEKSTYDCLISRLFFRWQINCLMISTGALFTPSKLYRYHLISTAIKVQCNQWAMSNWWIVFSHSMCENLKKKT